FLLESVERGEQMGRYTFLGTSPYMTIEARGGQIVLRRGRSEEQREGKILEILKEHLRRHRPAAIRGLPPFTSGAVGYLAYDVVRELEPVGNKARADLAFPDAQLMFFDRVLVFDHVRHQIHIVASADVTRERPRQAYGRALRDIAVLEDKL